MSLKIKTSISEAGIYEDGYHGDAPHNGYFTGDYPSSISGYPDVEVSYGKIHEEMVWRIDKDIAYIQYLPVTLRLKGTDYVIKKTCATTYIKYGS